MPSRFSPILSPEFINLHLQASEQNAAILETAAALSHHPLMGDYRVFSRELLEREAAGATHLSNGVALPHARTAQTSQLLIAAGRREQGIPFAGAAAAVRLIFVVAAPRTLIGEYLATVGMLARSLREPACLQRLLTCESTAEFAGVFDKP